MTCLKKMLEKSKKNFDKLFEHCKTKTAVIDKLNKTIERDKLKADKMLNQSNEDIKRVKSDNDKLHQIIDELMQTLSETNP